MGDFESDSYLGKLVAQAKNSDKSLLAGLPDRPYLMYGDATLTPEVAQSLFNEMATILKQSPGDMKKDDLDKLHRSCPQVPGGHAVSVVRNGGPSSRRKLLPDR